MKFAIFPHMLYGESGDKNGGGELVLILLAKFLHNAGYESKIVKRKNIGFYLNDIYNDFIPEDEVDEDFVIIYCEGTLGVPIKTKKIIRWVLSELGQNVPYVDIFTWNPKELVFFYGSEVCFKNDSSHIGTLYQLMNFLYIAPFFKNLNFPRQGWCHSFRKGARIHNKINILHPLDSFEIKSQTSHNDLAQIFNTYKYFICYDPISFLNTLAAVCGCVSVVYPIENYSRQSWLEKTHMAFLKEPIYGIAYGIEEIDYATNTLSLVEEQQKKITESINQKSIANFLNVISQDNNINIVENIFRGKVFVFDQIDNISSVQYGLPGQMINVGINKYHRFFKLCFSEFGYDPVIGKHKKLFISCKNGDSYEYHDEDILLISNKKIVNQEISEWLKTPDIPIIVSYSSSEIDSQSLHDIFKLKDSCWKYGLVSQFNWFEKYYLHPGKHFILSLNQKIIGYCLVKECSEYSSYIIIDNLIIDENYRGRAFGSNLLKKIFGKYSNQSIILISENENVSFYQKNGFLVSSNISFNDKILTATQKILTLNINTIDTVSLSYYASGLISDGILGGITMVSYPHLIFLIDYITLFKPFKMAEFGVAKGGVIALAAKANPNMNIYAFDSWEGMPPITEENDSKHKQYENVAWPSISDVKESFKKIRAPLNNVHLIKGYIEQTLDYNLHNLDNLDILRLDFNWYSATKIVLEQVYSKINIGGLIIIDNYYFNIGCQKAVDEFRQSLNITSIIYHSYKSPNLVYWIKE